MASPIGIGDVYTILTLTLNLCKDVRAAPQDIQAAVQDLEQMKVVLQYLKTEIGDEKSFMSRRKDVVKVVINGMKPLKDDLTEMKDMLDDYISRPSISIMGRLQYAVLDKNRLQDLRTCFAVHRGSISMMLQVIHGTAAKEQSSKLDQILLSHEQARREQKAQEKRTKNLLSQIETRISDARTDTSISTADALQQVEDDLVARGVSRQSAKDQLLPFVEVLLSNPSTPQPRTPTPTAGRPTSIPVLRKTSSPSGPTLAVPKTRPRSSSTPAKKPRDSEIRSSSQNQSHRKSSSSTPVSEDKTIPVYPASNTEGLRILVVDGSNGMRSVVAQTYLEIMRAWVAHRTGRWLFKRVDSAGQNIGTDFATPFITNSPFPDDQHNIPHDYVSQIDSSNYEWSLDYPNEIEAILNRIKNHKVRGLRGSDFTTYDIIICFGQKSRLSKMGAAAAADSGAPFDPKKLISLECPTIVTKDILGDETKMKDRTNSVKAAIKGFIATGLRQEIILSVNKGLRILQFELPTKNGSMDSPSKIKQLEKQSGCGIAITELGNNTYLVSIIGPKESNIAKGNTMCTLAKVEAVIRGQKKWT